MVSKEKIGHGTEQKQTYCLTTSLSRLVVACEQWS